LIVVPHPEILLIIGMAGLYLYDSALLLASNEALLCRGWRGRWIALFGAEGFPVRGKEPLLPNPLLPHRPLYRFSWNMEKPAAEQIATSQPWTPPPGKGYALLAPWVWLMSAALFVLVPLGLFSRLGHTAIAAGIVLFYAAAAVALTLTWLRRAVYALGGRQFAALAAECLFCPPLALNLIRRLSLIWPSPDDFLAVMGRYLTEPDRGAALAKMIVRLRNEIDWEDEGTPRARLLQDQLAYLLTQNHVQR
jgi:hypothetical protein